MKKFKNFAIMEREDIEGAMNRVTGELLILRNRGAANAVAAATYKRIEPDAHLILSAAAVAAEVAAHQGGLVILPEGLTDAQRAEVAAKIQELRARPGENINK